MALLAFNGTVMRGEPAHGNLKGAQFLEEVRTAPTYRLYSIQDRYPAMIRCDHAGAAIEAELYEVPDEVWPSIRDKEPAGLYRGAIELEDGRQLLFGQVYFIPPLRRADPVASETGAEPTRLRN